MEILSLFIASVILYGIPLLYATVGEIMTEKSGSLNLGVEGIMAVGAIIGYLVGSKADSMFVAMLFAFVSAAMLGLLFAFLTVTLKANQNVTGLTITTFGLGFYFFIGKACSSNWITLGGNFKKVYDNSIGIPLLSKIPVVGEKLFSYNIFVYLGIVIAILAFIYLYKTKAGLKTRAIGENPAAADAAGINVNAYKYINIIIGAGIMGVGGLCMGLNMGGTFEGSNCWINGYGWIAIALVIFAKWNPLWAIAGTFVFGFFNTLQVYRGIFVESFPNALGWLSKIPIEFYKALPFIITALVLIISSVRKKKVPDEPTAIGLNYYREDR